MQYETHAAASPANQGVTLRTWFRPASSATASLEACKAVHSIWHYLAVLDCIWRYQTVFNSLGRCPMVCFDGTVLYLKVFYCIWWCSMVFNRIWWYLTAFDGILYFTVFAIFDGARQNLTVLNDIWRYCTISVWNAQNYNLKTTCHNWPLNQLVVC